MWSALLATAQVLVIGWLAGSVLAATLFLALFFRRCPVRQPAAARPANAPAPAPAPVAPQPETPIETPNGGVYTVSEYQTLQAQFTARQWETLQTLAAQYAALHAPLD